MRRRSHRSCRGVTLLELLIVIAIIGVLASLLLSGVRSARDAGQKAACVSNLRQIGVAIASYASDHEGRIPYGPKAGAFSNAGNFYPSTGAPTSLISLQSGDPVALGLLLKDYLSRTPRVLFCPGTDQAMSAEKQLAKVGSGQAQCGYYYRHGGNTNLFDDQYADPPETEPPLLLGALGDNRKGKPIRALVMDSIFLCPKELKDFGVTPVSNHHGLVANVLYIDGHVKSQNNDNNSFTVDVRSYPQVRQSFSNILAAFEAADELQ